MNPGSSSRQETSQCLSAKISVRGGKTLTFKLSELLVTSPPSPNTHMDAISIPKVPEQSVVSRLSRGVQGPAEEWNSARRLSDGSVALHQGYPLFRLTCIYVKKKVESCSGHARKTRNKLLICDLRQGASKGGGVGGGESLFVLKSIVVHS